MMILLGSVRRFALALVAVLAMGASPVLAEPALWAIKDKDSTIYLFGTVHVLKPTTQWRSPKIAKAFQDADDVVMEIEQPEDPATTRALMLKYGVDPAAPLSGKLKPESYAKLQAAAQGMGFPPQALEPMRPWLAALTVSLTPLLKAGYDPESGVEKLLTAQAKAAGKPISAFETMEQQVRFFADMTPVQETQLLESTLDEIDDGPAKIDALVAAWAAGDQAELKRQMVDEMQTDYPDVYKLLLVDRNQDWANQLKAKLAGSGVSFVAVGAGHLTGPDSLQAQLAKLGVKAERVE
ncbi:TraB/GumN family protein [Caulobacter sp. UNC279MFTsu5.1]|uniref:TraB/GumN family protein n=1 Tax=Caulobacter sp. UNC279MFTsu5.1 TaxID=1502775 RepID=UPI000368DCE8|nr:TraB/GumN family protein [Caulobacter sp. UNC279MFTsu5.1]